MDSYVSFVAAVVAALALAAPAVAAAPIHDTNCNKAINIHK